MEAERWGRRIRAYRKLKGFTQEKLAKAVGMSVSVLGEIERGNRMPPENRLHSIAEALQISVEELTPKSEE